MSLVRYYFCQEVIYLETSWGKDCREEILNPLKRWHTDTACVRQSFITVAKHSQQKEGRVAQWQKACLE